MRLSQVLLRGVMIAMLPLIAGGEAVGDPGRTVRRAARPVAGEYIVVLYGTQRPDLPQIAMEMVEARGGKLLHLFRHGLQGFGARMSESAAENLLGDPRVAWVEENALGEFSGHSCYPEQHSFELECYCDDEHWHLDRIDQYAAVQEGAQPCPYGSQSTENEQRKAYGWTYSGSGVDVYIVDTGVMATHQEFSSAFGTRVTAGANFIGSDPANQPCVGDVPFNNGHGTAVASLAAGNSVGVARGANIVPVKVADCDTGAPDLIATVAGLDWVLGQRYEFGRPSVVNMSLYFRLSEDQNECIDQQGNYPTSCLSALENQIRLLVHAAVPVVVSANNQYQNRCFSTSTLPAQTPARLGYQGDAVPGALGTITVGGTDIADNRYSCASCPAHDRGSNHGHCVSIYAPAKRIRSAHILGTTSYRSRQDEHMSSGTSFSAPIVAGIAARWLDQFPWLTAQETWNWIRATARTLPSDFDSDGHSHNDRLAYIDVYH